MTTTTLILQIVTIVVSVISMVLGVLNTLRENRRTHYIEIVTAQRLRNKEKIQQAAKTIMQYTDSAVISQSDANCVLMCAEAAAEISVVLKNIYPEENYLIKQAEVVVSELNKYLNSVTKEEKDLMEARAEFYKQFSIYDLSDWKFIKSQAYGDATDSDDFDKIYNETSDKYSSSDIKYEGE